MVSDWDGGVKMRDFAAISLLLGLVTLAPENLVRNGQEADQEREESSGPRVVGRVDGDPIVKLLPQDAIMSLDKPEMVPAAEADGFMLDQEMVLGVDEDGQARAYSTWHLDRHEVVNDSLGETPIAATW